MKKQQTHFRQTAPHKKKYRRRSHFFGNVTRLLFLFALVLGSLTYLYPEQTRDTLQRLEAQFPDLPKLSEKISWTKSTPDGLYSENLEVHFLDVGEGLSILVKADGHALLYDGGDYETASSVIAYLQNQGVHSLDYVIASHYDSDHLSGLVEALENFPVKQVFGPDYTYDSYTYSAFLRALNSSRLELEHPAVGSAFSLGNASFTVLSPSRIAEEPNNNSLAIRLVNGSDSFLFSGDAEQPCEEDMCDSGLTLQSDVLCPGHHGSSDATCRQFLDRVRPDYAVISCGAGNEFGHPHRSVLQRLYDAGVTVCRTDQSGTIVACSDGQWIEWSV